MLLIINALLLAFLRLLPDPATPPVEPPVKEPPKEPAGQDPATGEPPQDGTKLTDPAALQSELDRARRETATARTKANTAAEEKQGLVTAFGPLLAMLGIETKEGTAPDPVQLQKAVEGYRTKYRAERMSNALTRITAELGAKPDLTLRYLRGGEELADIDPESEGFEADLKTVVQAAMEKEPTLRKGEAGPPARSGAEFGGTATKGLDQQIKDAEDAGDIRLAIRLKEAKANVSTAPVTH